MLAPLVKCWACVRSVWDVKLKGTIPSGERVERWLIVNKFTRGNGTHAILVICMENLYGLFRPYKNSYKKISTTTLDDSRRRRYVPSDSTRLDDGMYLRYSVFGTRYSVLGIRYSVLGTRYSVFGTRYSVLRIRKSVKVHTVVESSRRVVVERVLHSENSTHATIFYLFICWACAIYPRKRCARRLCNLC